MPSQNSDSSQPLLSPSNEPPASAAAGETVDPNTLDEDNALTREYSYSRKWMQEFLASRTQHFFIIVLVSLDLLGIFADIFINLYTCEEGKPSPAWDIVRNGLGIAGLVFSCIFMIELILSVWAFGWRYFKSYFHTFDAVVIVAGFIVDVLLHGILEEIASLVIILRLWRFFKIFEEFSVGAQEQMAGLELRIENLEEENRELKSKLRKVKGGDEESQIGMRERA